MKAYLVVTFVIFAVGALAVAFQIRSKKPTITDVITVVLQSILAVWAAILYQM